MEEEFDYDTGKTKKIGAKKARKLEMKAEKQAQREVNLLGKCILESFKFTLQYNSLTLNCTYLRSSDTGPNLNFMTFSTHYMYMY